MFILPRYEKSYQACVHRLKSVVYVDAIVWKGRPLNLSCNRFEQLTSYTYKARETLQLRNKENTITCQQRRVNLVKSIYPKSCHPSSLRRWSRRNLRSVPKKPGPTKRSMWWRATPEEGSYAIKGVPGRCLQEDVESNHTDLRVASSVFPRVV